MYNRSYMKTEEKKNEWIVNFFGCQKDIRVIFGAIFVVMIIYFIAMCYFFCCGREPNSDTLWGSAANFGNMYGALGCLFSGFAFAAMWATFIKQGEQLKIQEKSIELMKKGIDKQAESIDCQREAVLQTDRSNEERKFISMIDGFHNDIMNMCVRKKRGSIAVDQLFWLAIQAVKSIDKNEIEISDKDVEKFTKSVHYSFYHLSFKALYIFKSLNDNAILQNPTKKSLCQYFISSMTTSTKKLLDIMFLLNDSLKKFEFLNSFVLDHKAQLFSHNITYNMITKHANVEYGTIELFFNKIKEVWSVQE